MDITEHKSKALVLVGGGSEGRHRKTRKLCARLIAGYRQLTSGPEKPLCPGELVQWKPGMKNRTTPEYDMPMVVVEVLAAPFLDTKFDSGSVYFREPLDIILGFIDEGDEFSALYYDSRRFELYEQSRLE